MAAADARFPGWDSRPAVPEELGCLGGGEDAGWLWAGLAAEELEKAVRHKRKARVEDGQGDAMCHRGVVGGCKV